MNEKEVVLLSFIACAFIFGYHYPKGIQDTWMSQSVEIVLPSCGDSKSISADVSWRKSASSIFDVWYSKELDMQDGTHSLLDDGSLKIKGIQRHWGAHEAVYLCVKNNIIKSRTRIQFYAFPLFQRIQISCLL